MPNQQDRALWQPQSTIQPIELVSKKVHRDVGFRVPIKIPETLMRHVAPSAESQVESLIEGFGGKLVENLTD